MNKKNTKQEELPKYCDYFCKYAAFADPNAVGGCRRELAVWCKKVQKYNNKNNKCIANHTL